MNEVSDSKFVTRKWNIFNDQMTNDKLPKCENDKLSNANYDVGNEIKYNTEVLKSNLCDHNDVYILVRGDITVKVAPATQKAFKNCAPFTKCITKIDEKTIDDAENLDLVMPMYNLIEYSSNYSETNLWFYSKDEVTNFNADIANTNDFKSFKYKAKLLGNTTAQPVPNDANGIPRNVTIAVPLKFLSNFFRSFGMPLINCKAELKLKWTKYCVLSPACNNNYNDNENRRKKITFTIKYTKLHVPFATLLARDNQKLSKRLSMGFERLVYWNEYKAESATKTTTNEFRYFLESNFVGINKLFVLYYLNRDNDVKRFKTRIYYLPKKA